MLRQEIYQLTKKLHLPLTVSERAKHLFHAGVAGQGFVGFLDVETGMVELVPAWNKDDGKERKPLLYQGKYYGVESIEPLGSNSGDAHVKGLAQIGLAHKGGINGGILGFGIFKEGKQNIKEFRNRSASQNRFAVKYNELFALTFGKGMFLSRSIPMEIAQQLLTALLHQLPVSKKELTGKNDCDNKILEDIFLSLSELDIESHLIVNLFGYAEEDSLPLSNMTPHENADLFKRTVNVVNQQFPLFLARCVSWVIYEPHRLNCFASFLKNYLYTFNMQITLGGLEELLCNQCAPEIKNSLIPIFKNVIQKNKELLFMVIKFCQINRFEQTIKMIFSEYNFTFSELTHLLIEERSFDDQKNITSLLCEKIISYFNASGLFNNGDTIYQLSATELREVMVSLACYRSDLAVMILNNRNNLFENREEVESTIAELETLGCLDLEVYLHLHQIKQKFPVKETAYNPAIAFFQESRDELKSLSMNDDVFASVEDISLRKQTKP